MQEIQGSEMGDECSKEAPEVTQERGTNVGLNEDDPRYSVLTYEVRGAQLKDCDFTPIRQGDGNYSITMRAVDGSVAYTKAFSVPQDVWNKLGQPRKSKERSKLIITLPNPSKISLYRYVYPDPQTN